jgi:hypothetical protein
MSGQVESPAVAIARAHPFPIRLRRRHDVIETRYWFCRIGSVCAIVGSLAAAVGNVLHPVAREATRSGP